ncbi:hypothetical protein GW17_00031680 [Ensete ventricosum]|nr:hypothetical protein GW17_00031680 [Ensete ventricosum]
MCCHLTACGCSAFVAKGEVQRLGADVGVDDGGQAEVEEKTRTRRAVGATGRCDKDCPTEEEGRGCVRSSRGIEDELERYYRPFGCEGTPKVTVGEGSNNDRGERWRQNEGIVVARWKDGQRRQRQLQEWGETAASLLLYAQLYGRLWQLLHATGRDGTRGAILIYSNKDEEEEERVRADDGEGGERRRKRVGWAMRKEGRRRRVVGM